MTKTAKNYNNKLKTVGAPLWHKKEMKLKPDFELHNLWKSLLADSHYWDDFPLNYCLLQYSIICLSFTTCWIHCWFQHLGDFWYKSITISILLLLKKIWILLIIQQFNEIFCHPDDILGNIRILFLSKIKIIENNAFLCG